MTYAQHWTPGRCASCGMERPQTARVRVGGYSIRLCRTHAEREQRTVCHRCGLTVARWNRGGADFWKHHGTRGKRACGSAMPVLRVWFDEEGEDRTNGPIRDVDHAAAVS